MSEAGQQAAGSRHCPGPGSVRGPGGSHPAGAQALWGHRAPWPSERTGGSLPRGHSRPSLRPEDRGPCRSRGDAEKEQLSGRRGGQGQRQAGTGGRERPAEARLPVLGHAERARRRRAFPPPPLHRQAVCEGSTRGTKPGLSLTPAAEWAARATGGLCVTACGVTACGRASAATEDVGPVTGVRTSGSTEPELRSGSAAAGGSGTADSHAPGGAGRRALSTPAPCQRGRGARRGRWEGRWEGSAGPRGVGACS